MTGSNTVSNVLFAGFQYGVAAQADLSRTIIIGLQVVGGAAGNMICVLGTERGGYAPIVLIDGQERTILIYEYAYANDEIELTSARTFEFDRLIKEFNVEGLSVGEVQAEVTRRR